ncbi:unnamed protein product [Rotaria sordida]|uniref:Right handed beta helix domain-containing protein n=1 Tax=Rotaria sordida TaxID=392033 RepID=A0A819JMC6_9BILA|nr:unnamed protein product [Rotaria sordida]CAF3932888.1 unnamed protein product [Rotaria sordida]
MYRRLPTASISGGIPVTDWTLVGGNTYKAVMTQPIFVNQLFVDNRRIVRTRIPINQSEQVQIITPVNEFVVLIAGTNATNPVEGIIIDNVAIQYSAWNIGRTQQADYQAASFLTTAPLYIANATSIIISNVEVSHTGSYGVWIKEATTDINIINSLITDTGAGGIRIGQMIAPVPTPTSSINIISNEVSYGGNVFPSGVGVISHRAIDVVIADNSIHHHRYTGVSIGWEWGYSPSYTSSGGPPRGNWWQLPHPKKF